MIDSEKLLPSDKCKSCIGNSKISDPEKKKPFPRNLVGIPRVSLNNHLPVISSNQLLISLYTEDGSLYYSISDIHRLKLLAGESFCDLSQEEVCQESLPEEGDYIFRVSGGSSDVNGNGWKFCGVKGGVPSEVSFSWKQGTCTVLQIDSDSITSKLSVVNNAMEGDSMLPMITVEVTSLSYYGVLALLLVVGITVLAVAVIGVIGFRS